MKKIIILILFLLTACIFITPNYDPYYTLDPYFVIKATGTNPNTFNSSMTIELENTLTRWGLAEEYLVLARLNNNTNFYRNACKYFIRIYPESIEEKAVKYETLASLNCGGNSKRYLKQASKEWDKLNLHWRSELLLGAEPIFDLEEPKPNLNLSNKQTITIGSSKIEINPLDVVLTQEDRVFRDWLGSQLRQSPFKGTPLKTFSETKVFAKNDLREDIGWHEGGRLLDIQKRTPVYHEIAVGTLIAKNNNKWYATDENGIFRFEVPVDKISYPTVRFLREDLASIIDTHGINTMVEQAIRKKANVVIGCCDHPGKVKATLYLAKKNISSLCFPDRFLYLSLGQNNKALGSPPWRYQDNKTIFGDTPITLKRNQKIVVMNAEEEAEFALWYYTSPFLYFSEITKTFPLDMYVVKINNYNQSRKIFDKAREVNANIVAARIYNKGDYKEAKSWLEENKNNKIILFHSTPYPYGVLLTKEYPNQISFDDPNVV